MASQWSISGDQPSSSPPYTAFQSFLTAIGREHARRASRYWWLYMLLGAASIALGAFTLSSRLTALSTLVFLFSLYLVYNGAFEISMGMLTRRRWWLSLIIGALSVAAGFLALSWPSITLFVLALFVGWSLVVWGLFDIVLSLTDPVIRPRWLMLVTGIVLAAAGTLALAAPGITVVLLATLVGVFLVMYGFFSFVAGVSCWICVRS